MAQQVGWRTHHRGGTNNQFADLYRRRIEQVSTSLDREANPKHIKWKREKERETREKRDEVKATDVEIDRNIYCKRI